jgi:putative ABC transport system permease protein
MFRKSHAGHSVASMARAELRARPGRATTLGAGILVAALSFGLLSSETATSSAQVTSTVKHNFRAAYDILVRPKNAETAFEKEHGVVDDGFLSGLFGGITMKQYDETKSLSGVSLAAPVANVGYFLYQETILVPFPKSVSRSRPSVFKVGVDWDAHNGLSKYPGAPLYLYWTPGAINFVPSGDKYQPSPIGEENKLGTSQPLPVCRGWTESFPSASATGTTGGTGQGAAGTGTAAAGATAAAAVVGPYQESSQPNFDCAAKLVTLDRKSVDTNEPNVIDGEPSGELGAEVTFDIPVLVAGIDPKAEDTLVGLKNATASGSYLDEDAGLSAPGNVPGTNRPAQCARWSLSQSPDCDVRTYPVIASTNTYLDEAADLTVQQLKIPAGANLETQIASSRNAYSFITNLSGPIVAKLSVNPTTAWRHALTGFTSANGFTSNDGSGFSLAYWRPSPTDNHVTAAGTITPSTVANDPNVWSDDSTTKDVVGVSLAPPASDDTWYRSLTAYGASFAATTIDGKRTAVTPLPTLVGTFDPTKLRGFSPLSQVPLQTFYPPTVTAGNAGAKKALGGSALGPTSNIAGYLSQPPLLLTTIEGAIALDNGDGDSATVGPGLHAQAYQGASPAAPISTIQVRVKGVTGPNAASLDKIEAVASQIEQRTGLTVDVTAGSSPTTERVSLAPGKFGQPTLLVAQGWAKKGVAIGIARALASKNLALFLLVLTVCGLFVASATTASVRGRRREIAILGTLGWQARTVFSLILGEAALVGLVAGAVGCAVTCGLAVAGSLDIPAVRLGLVVPVAVALAVIAAAVPAGRAAKITPRAALRDPVRRSPHRRNVRRIRRLALVNVTQVPGRSALAVTTLTLGVGAFAFIVGVDLAFQGKVTGNLLGGIVSTDVRSVDIVTTALVVLLSAASVADVLSVSLRERSTELATLRAVGWTERSITSMAAHEGLVLGLTGSVLGAAAGLGTTALAGGKASSALAAAAIAVGVGCIVTMLVLAILLVRLPRPAPAQALGANE